jgi:hypothetical protein
MDDYVEVAVRSVGEREKREYNSFGPWVQEIKDLDDLPPRFDSYRDELRSAVFLAKVPYHVERREALPGSDLYEHLLAILPDALALFSLQGGSILRRDLRYGRIASISLVSVLLDGLLVVEDADGLGLELHFNTVSAKLVRNIVDLVRARCRDSKGRAEDSGRIPGPDLAADPGEDDVLYANLLAELRSREAPLSLLAYQDPCRLKTRGTERRSLGRRLLDELRRYYLGSVMLLEAQSELIIVRDSTEMRRRKFRGYRYEIAWLPFSSVKGARLEERTLPNEAVASVLHLSASSREYEFYFVAPPEPAVKRLAALAGRG